MNTKFLLTLLTAFLCQQCSQGQEEEKETNKDTVLPCNKETDLDFESCTLDKLNDDVLKDICDRIGLDMENHVLPYLFDSDDDDNKDSIEGDDENNNNNNDNNDNNKKKKTIYTHSDYVQAAEECLLIEDEMERLSIEDPQMLEQLEREALQQDPSILADVISDIFKQDKLLLQEIIAKLSKDRPELIREIMGEGLLEEGEGLVDRPDVMGFFLAGLLNEDPSLLDEFDNLLSDGFFGDYDDIDDDDMDEMEDEWGTGAEVSGEDGDRSEL